MRAHERNDYNDSPISNELFWGVVAVFLAAVSALIGWFGLGAWGSA